MPASYRTHKCHRRYVSPQVVLADGTVLDLLSNNRKDNTGYALKHLFVGAEGTLGVVTRCSLAVPARPASVSVALLALSDFDGVERVLGLARARLGEVLSAVEFMDKETVALTLEKCQGVRSPFGSPGSGGGGGKGGEGGHEFYVLIETSGSDAAHDAEKLDGFLEAAMELVSRRARHGMGWDGRGVLGVWFSDRPYGGPTCEHAPTTFEVLLVCFLCCRLTSCCPCQMLKIPILVSILHCCVVL